MKTEQCLPSVYKSMSLDCNLNTYTPTTWLPFWPSRPPLIWLVVILIKLNRSMPSVASAWQCRTVWIYQEICCHFMKVQMKPKMQTSLPPFWRVLSSQVAKFLWRNSERFVQIASNKPFNYHCRLWPVLSHILFWAKHILSSKMIALKILKWIITEKK